MEKKLSLANKYRPKVFEDLSEQTSVKTILENQIANKNIKHAYLFCGGAGTGKTTTARIIASMINEGKGRTIEIDCASNNGVDDMRRLQEDCRNRPIDCKYKIYLLDECHMLTVQAWNSLLKILEEPPDYVVFLMCTTDPQKILPTILSRVQRFNFNRISTEGIIKRLKVILEKENIIDYENSAIEYIARLAKGGMRDAITTLEKCLDFDKHLTLEVVHKVMSGGVSEETMLNLMRLILDRNAKDALIAFNNVYMSGMDTLLFLKLYIEFIENCIKYIITSDTNIITISDISVNWLKNNTQFLEDIRGQLMDLLRIRSGYSSEDLKIILESWIVKECNL